MCKWVRRKRRNILCDMREIFTKTGFMYFASRWRLREQPASSSILLTTLTTRSLTPSLNRAAPDARQSPSSTTVSS